MDTRSVDLAVQEMLEVALQNKIETAWDRLNFQQPQCGFGELGLCCRNCTQGPCRIDPFGDGPRKGVCGADADTLVARNLARSIVAGTASHSGHSKHLAHVLKKWADGKAPDYPVKDERKLLAVAQRHGIEVEGKEIKEIARSVAEVALEDFSERNTPIGFANRTVTKNRAELWNKFGVNPVGIDSIIAEMMHRTTLGVDADANNLLLGSIAAGIADYAGCRMGTDLSDILFGTPAPVISEMNMAVLDPKQVNVALHGHNPVLSDLLVQVSREMREEAKMAGATGINLVGICCTGSEVLMRHGVPSCTHSVSQELPILTGVLDAMVVDYQCVYPSIATLAGCYSTKVITTMSMAKIPGAIHIEIHEEGAWAKGKEILRLAIEAFKERAGRLYQIPRYKEKVVAGFSKEAIVAALAKLNQEEPLQPLIDNIVNGNIQGICLFAGCNNVKVRQDENYIIMAKELAKRNVLLLATGCGAGSLGRLGFMNGEATKAYAGDGMKDVLSAIGEANGLEGPLPPVLHLGSCVDNSRAVDIAVAIAEKLGVDTDMLPVVASAPEYKTEKAFSIGTYAVALGLPTHLGMVPPVAGSKQVVKTLTKDIREITGGYFIVETNPSEAAKKLFLAIQERRAGLGLLTRLW
ncbi:anaerobic carbon-monoxide dehydrogenase catalytic subunit [Heliobacillus mobilis]|uniref:Carbon monoxide dehydrogenase n=1 Tax=Heliobacterium mobile TaxID=28064 RepID=A0A6I3SJ71_HELMO|nr:anaerobic carbon-monoxide dehydrogenase catalytic subunit [Heliobacterium mobile]MTV48866.1 anaerobic carbon-monoxide dehydrogenase catalytic subunit [Heliobacterium mobile]